MTGRFSSDYFSIDYFSKLIEQPQAVKYILSYYDTL